MQSGFRLSRIVIIESLNASGEVSNDAMKIYKREIQVAPFLKVGIWVALLFGLKEFYAMNQARGYLKMHYRQLVAAKNNWSVAGGDLEQFLEFRGMEDEYGVYTNKITLKNGQSFEGVIIKKIYRNKVNDGLIITGKDDLILYRNGNYYLMDKRLLGKERFIIYPYNLYLLDSR